MSQRDIKSASWEWRARSSGHMLGVWKRVYCQASNMCAVHRVLRYYHKRLLRHWKTLRNAAHDVDLASCLRTH